MHSDEPQLNAIAKAAGVGQGTLYRHFPSRAALLAEVYRDEVDDLVAAASRLLTSEPPRAALQAWLGRVVDYARVKRSVFAAVEASVSRGVSDDSHDRIGEAVSRLLEAGRADGTVRPDVDARDVILLIGYLSRLDDDEWDARAHHLVDVIMDGLVHRDSEERQVGPRPVGVQRRGRLADQR